MERNNKYKRIAFVNDEERIPSEMKYRKLTFEQACQYIMVGCNEPAFPGTIDLGGNNCNVARSLVNTLYQHEDEILECKDFDEFYTIYSRELARDLAEVSDWVNIFNGMRSKDINIISSLFMDGCIERGLSATQDGCEKASGATSLMGFVSVIDSLSIIRQFVYEEKRITMEQLMTALKDNWEGHADLRAEILRDGKFFGNSYPLSDEVAHRFTDSIDAMVGHIRGLFTRAFFVGNLTGYHPHYAWFGKATPATPDGRFAGDAFGVGSGQMMAKIGKG